jgi:hypothetical protein
MTGTTGSESHRGEFTDGQEAGSSWVKAYGGGHKTREYGSTLDDDAVWRSLDAVATSSELTRSRTERWMLAAAALLVVIVAIVLKSASSTRSDTAATSNLSTAAVGWGHLGLGVLCFLTLAALVLAAVRR